MMNMDGSVFVQVVPEKYQPALRVFSKVGGCGFEWI
jgi:hypothetical protein